MKIKQLQLFIGVFLLLVTDVHFSYAQWGVGASYEIRGEDPTHGFGARIDYDILDSVPLVSLTVRAHLSYFQQTKVSVYELSGLRSEVRKELKAYDFGASILAGGNIAMVKPYAGMGLGLDSSQFFTVESTDSQNNFKGINEENLYWNLFAGAEFTLLPIVNPFVEFRVTNIVNPRNIEYDDFGRVAFGIMFRF